MFNSRTTCETIYNISWLIVIMHNCGFISDGGFEKPSYVDGRLSAIPHIVLPMSFPKRIILPAG